MGLVYTNGRLTAECINQPRRFRFPDHEWWVKRSACRPIPQHRIDRRPAAAREYGTDAERVVKRMVERIVERFDPIAVWLFGSVARGNCTKHSDVDLLVIMPDGANRRAAALGIIDEVSDSMLPKDIVVNTVQQWNRRLVDVGSIQRAVYREGVMLYG